MALSVLHLNHAITISSSLLRNHFSAISSSHPQIPSIHAKTPLQFLAPSPFLPHASSLWHHSYSHYNNSNNNDEDKISPDTILFEGCDYNHWLITMEFLKDPKPTPEEMVETQTLAKVVGRSVSSFPVTIFNFRWSLKLKLGFLRKLESESEASMVWSLKLKLGFLRKLESESEASMVSDSQGTPPGRLPWLLKIASARLASRRSSGDEERLGKAQPTAIRLLEFNE